MSAAGLDIPGSCIRPVQWALPGLSPSPSGLLEASVATVELTDSCQHSEGPPLSPAVTPRTCPAKHTQFCGPNMPATRVPAVPVHFTEVLGFRVNLQQTTQIPSTQPSSKRIAVSMPHCVPHPAAATYVAAQPHSHSPEQAPMFPLAAQQVLAKSSSSQAAGPAVRSAPEVWSAQLKGQTAALQHKAVHPGAQLQSFSSPSAGLQPARPSPPFAELQQPSTAQTAGLQRCIAGVTADAEAMVRQQPGTAHKAALQQHSTEKSAVPVPQQAVEMQQLGTAPKAALQQCSIQVSAVAGPQETVGSKDSARPYADADTDAASQHFRYKLVHAAGCMCVAAKLFIAVLHSDCFCLAQRYCL